LPNYNTKQITENQEMTFDSNMKLNQEVLILLQNELKQSEKETIQDLRTLIASDSNIQENQNISEVNVTGITLNAEDAKIVSDHLEKLQNNKLN
jgi:hypothetical protein